MDNNMPLEAQLATWLGIVSQLYTSRMNQMLSAHELTIGQFALLNHLARHGERAHTISDLTNALEVNQPAVTKIVKKFEGMGIVAISADPQDSRKRLVSITPDGYAALGKIQQQLAPDVFAWFAEWDEAERTAFLSGMQKLGSWLDDNRLLIN